MPCLLKYTFWISIWIVFCNSNSQSCTVSSSLIVMSQYKNTLWSCYYIFHSSVNSEILHETVFCKPQEERIMFEFQGLISLNLWRERDLPCLTKRGSNSQTRHSWVNLFPKLYLDLYIFIIFFHVSWLFFISSFVVSCDVDSGTHWFLTGESNLVPQI